MANIFISCLALSIIGHVMCQNSGVTVPNQEADPSAQGGGDKGQEVVVQHPVTVNIQEPQALTTPPPVAPLKTRVVVVHNNMVPVPIECFQPPDSGTCSKDLARVYYDHNTRTCKPFSYTGCGGNANRFQSIKNCYRICHPYRYKIRPKVANHRSKATAIKVRQIPLRGAGEQPPQTPQMPQQPQGPRMRSLSPYPQDLPPAPQQQPFPGGYGGGGGGPPPYGGYYGSNQKPISELQTQQIGQSDPNGNPLGNSGKMTPQ